MAHHNESFNNDPPSEDDGQWDNEYELDELDEQDANDGKGGQFSEVANEINNGYDSKQFSQDKPFGPRPQPNFEHPANIQRLLSDPRGMTSNPYSMDWTTTPFAAMKLTIDYSAELLKEIPAAIEQRMNLALIDAKRCNKESSAELVAQLTDLFFRYEVNALGRQGIYQELASKTDAFSRLLDQQKGAELQMKDLVGAMADKSAEFKDLIDQRWINLKEKIDNVDKAESQVKQREAKLLDATARYNTKLKAFQALGFWGHISLAFRALLENLGLR
jgi:hypothetical protein